MALDAAEVEVEVEAGAVVAAAVVAAVAVVVAAAGVCAGVSSIILSSQFIYHDAPPYNSTPCTFRSPYSLLRPSSSRSSQH